MFQILGENILIEYADYKIKLIDFGGATYVKDKSERTFTGNNFLINK